MSSRYGRSKRRHDKARIAKLEQEVRVLRGMLKIGMPSYAARSDSQGEEIAERYFASERAKAFDGLFVSAGVGDVSRETLDIDSVIDLMLELAPRRAGDELAEHDSRERFTVHPPGIRQASKYLVTKEAMKLRYDIDI